jgi:hypothetical protein
LRLRVELTGPADRIRLKIYSRAFVVAADLEAHGSFQAGWNDIQLDGSGLAAGAWFCKIEASSGGTKSQSFKPFRLYKLP